MPHPSWFGREVKDVFWRHGRAGKAKPHGVHFLSEPILQPLYWRRNIRVAFLMPPMTHPSQSRDGLRDSMKQAGKSPIDAALRASPAPHNQILFFRDTRVMFNPPAPFKTPLGLDELRHRTRGLGQRHRTVLLLIDGHRALGEVLGMAHRAGASTSHFEELLHLGLVEMPVEPAQEPPETGPGALNQTRLTSVQVDVPAEPDTCAVPTADTPLAFSSNSSAPEVEPELAPAPQPVAVDAASCPDATQASPASQGSAGLPFRETRADPTPRPSPMPDDLQEVRGLLIGALGTDAALFSPLILARIRTAQTPDDLIELVWDIERQRNHARRRRTQLHSLQDARERLGMGNTMVAGDSETGAVWPDTIGR